MNKEVQILFDKIMATDLPERLRIAADLVECGKLRLALSIIETVTREMMLKIMSISGQDQQ